MLLNLLENVYKEAVADSTIKIEMYTKSMTEEQKSACEGSSIEHVSIPSDFNSLLYMIVSHFKNEQNSLDSHDLASSNKSLKDLNNFD